MNTEAELNYKLFIHRENNFERLPYTTEMGLYTAVAEGDIEKIKENFKRQRFNFMEGKGVLSDDKIRNIRYHFIVAVALISRFCIESGMNQDASYTLADIYIRKADVCNSYQTIVDMFLDMQLDYAERMKKAKKNNVISLHIRKCIDYIYDHMHEKITVSILADYLNLNPTYLSKLFTKETGMNIGDFILNTKIKTAQNMLKFSDFSCLDISTTLGFSSQSYFISTFKKITGQTPKEYRNLHYNSSMLEENANKKTDNGDW